MKKLFLFLVALVIALVSCKPEQPKVVTTEVTEITVNSAVCGGGVLDGGGATIVERGFCWNTERKPTVLDFCVKDTESGLGSFTLNIPNLAPNTQYYIRTYAVNANGVAGYGEEVIFTTLEGTFANGHEYVDLGLSVKWATCNFGATSSEEYGAYMTYDKALESCKYWGGAWRLPTKEEMFELVDFCSWKWTTQNGVNGYKVTGPNGNSIFLPAAGFHHYGSSLYHAGEHGYYRSSTLNESYSNNAYQLFFDSSGRIVSDSKRNDGYYSVRPVLE